MTARQRPRIAVLLDYLYSDYQRELRTAIADAAAARDASVVVVLGQELRVPRDGVGRQRVVYDLVDSSNFDCVIVVQSSAFDRWGGADGMRRYCRRFAGMAVCGVSVDLGEPFPTVMVDNVAGMSAVVEHVIETHGCRRIAYLGGPDSNSEAHERELAFRRTLDSHAMVCDEALMASGDFSTAAGVRLTRRLIEAQIEFDAIVAANDYMALGAIEALKALGRCVPSDAIVVGFDDINIARLSNPALTTVRQPIKQFGMQAVDTVLGALRGDDATRRVRIAAEVVKRQSCGCESVAGALSTVGRMRADDGGSDRIPPSLRAAYDPARALITALQRSVHVPRELLPRWPERLIEALGSGPVPDSALFLRVLEDILMAAERHGAALEEFQRAITLLRSERRDEHSESDARALENLWHDARILISAAAVRAEGWRRLALENAVGDLAAAGTPISTALSLPSLKQALTGELPRLGVTRAAVSLYSADDQTLLTPFLVQVNGRVVDAHGGTFPSERLAPAAFFEDGRRVQALALGLAFDDEQLGVLVLETESNGIVVESLRAQIASAVKSAGLHHKVVEQVALRERLERERLQEEARIAAQIQTSLSPGLTEISGLELATTTLPAAQVGGDYHDVRPTPHGGWLAIGDVTGHGLASGLIMLMLQSMLAVTMDDDCRASPGAIIRAVNSALYSNIRHRLERDDYATLLVLRYERSGRVTFAGAHEEIIVWRARSRRCELIQSKGIWVGARPDVAEFCVDQSFALEDGDVLVLYTDGVTEARNAHHEQFGLNRLSALVEATEPATPTELRDVIVSAVRDWSAVPEDDLSLVIGRFQAAATA